VVDRGNVPSSIDPLSCKAGTTWMSWTATGPAATLAASTAPEKASVSDLSDHRDQNKCVFLN
jgi:hypothetical protein